MSTIYSEAETERDRGGSVSLNIKNAREWRMEVEAGVGVGGEVAMGMMEWQITLCGLDREAGSKHYVLSMQFLCNPVDPCNPMQPHAPYTGLSVHPLSLSLTKCIDDKAWRTTTIKLKLTANKTETERVPIHPTCSPIHPRAVPADLAG